MALIPALIPYKHSHAVPDEFLKGYFSKLDVRIHHHSDEEMKEVLGMYQDWVDRGGGAYRLSIVPRLGGIMSLTMPEADPKKLIDFSASCTFAMLEDDLYDGDMFVPEKADCSVPNSDNSDLRKKSRIILNQMKSKLFVELLKKMRHKFDMSRPTRNGLVRVPRPKI
ncbi:hypothetical protein H072_3793 [Dactylellina haptotyla CBS 200.50]|uniref:Uncharacterized protein n=1 Tax=Dactylellina haptotyla (strain CBS 200.50) TaxID=1284197 RepID=S8AMA0_DACHA|nr:hypothetical protein H072_3793 [Dactylellina haptotyla CBS 200.50]